MPVLKKITKDTLESLRFNQERILSARLSQILYADLLEPIFERCRYSDVKDYWQSIYAGQSFRLTPSLAPKLYDLCRQVKDILQFDEPVEFFIANNPTINAAAYLRESDKHTHLLIVNSGLIERFNDVELKFALGHEFAHIIYKTAELRRLILNLFPEEAKIPIPIQNMIRLWEKYAEISADRLGYLVSPNLESCLSNFFKLSSGLSFDKVNFGFKAYLEEVDTILSKFSETSALFEGSHPTNPVRVKAIQYFSESKLYNSFQKTGKIEDDPEFSAKMEDLVKLLELHPDNERDFQRLMLIAAGGYYMAGSDEAVKPEEEERILEFISNFTVYPKLYLQTIVEKKSIEELNDIMLGAIARLMEIDPGERYPIFSYLAQIAISDRELNEKELNALMSIATKYLEMHEIEASRLFVQTLREQCFRPKF